MFGKESTEKKKKSVFDKKGSDVSFGAFRRNQKDDSKDDFGEQNESPSLFDVLKESSEGLSEKDEPDKVVSIRFSVSWEKAELLFPVLIAALFIWAGFWISDSNEAELEAGRAKAAQDEMDVNAKVLKAFTAKNPKEPLPESLELLATRELGKNNVVVVDPWGKPYVYDRKNRLLRCIVRNPDGSVKYEIARRF